MAVDGPEFHEQLLGVWLESDDAKDTAARLVVKYRLDTDPAELLNETWVRLTTSLRRRSAGLPEMNGLQDAAKYGFRTMDNLCRDRVRSRQRRSEIALIVDDSVSIPIVQGDFDSIEQQEFLRRLLHAVSRAISDRPRCAGCANGVAEAAALQVVHVLLADDDASDSNRPWLDQLLYRSLEIVDPDLSDRSPEARRQRKSRCGRCVRDILSQALSFMGFES